MNLLAIFRDLRPSPYEVCWRSPANIAFVKYWGKKGHQIPANPSVSMTLKECFTETRLKITPGEFNVSLTLSKKPEPKFADKIGKYLLGLQNDLPWINKLRFEIETHNTFPHGAGIASSASGLSAFALGFADYLHSLNGEERGDIFFKRASFLARLASGSACRSVYGGFATWGECELEGSSDEYASPFEVHHELSDLQNTVLVISEEEKIVSSRAGHEQMHAHGYAEARFIEARRNFSTMINALRSGDMDILGEILENEALQLHAMMMTSAKSFTLLKPNTLLAIELIRDFRKVSQLPLYFTLDAGPNLHLIYPVAAKNKIVTFINNELKSLGVAVIDDQRGEGPVKCL